MPVDNSYSYHERAKAARRKVLDMLYAAQTSHIGSNFSVIDLLAVLFGVKKEQDKIILSAGWKAAAFYYFLAEEGTIPKKDLETYCKEGSPYIGLTEPTVAGVAFAGGSMGMGLSAGAGFALGKKIKKEEGRVYVIMSDGELQCGTTFETALIAARHSLDNLIAVVDRNGLQAMGATEDILPLEPIRDKFIDFHWDVAVCDGHDYAAIRQAFGAENTRPLLIIANTIKGKGVPTFEGNNLYHYKALSQEEYEEAMTWLK